MGNVRLYGSTSGYTELAPPAVAPDGVLSLPSGTGTLLTAEGGKVLQVVRATDATDRTTTSGTLVDASISVTITPQKSTSAILLFWTFLLTNATTSSSGFVSRQAITDNSNNVIGGESFIGVSSHSILSTVTLIRYDTPATISAVTYKGRFSRESNVTTSQIGNATVTGQMYAIEVSA